MAEMSYKEEFIKIYKDNIKRRGADSVLAWLEDSDFFTAPASTRFHLANFYKKDYRNVKNSEGVWEKAPYYTVEDTLPYGHGEKSAILLLQLGLTLSTEELVAIRWHMGGFDDAVKGGSYAMSTAYEKYPLAVLLNIADMKATYLDEVN